MQLLYDVSTAEAFGRYPRELAREKPPPGFYRAALARIETRGGGGYGVSE